MPHNITLIPGDGVGPEITEATKRVYHIVVAQFIGLVSLINQATTASYSSLRMIILTPSK